MKIHSQTPRRRTKQSLSRATVAGAALIGLLAANGALQAASGTWTGAGSDGNWSNATNWDGGVIPGSTSGTPFDTATFNNNGTTNLPIVIDSGRRIRNFTFDTASVGSYTIGSLLGNTLQVTGGGIFSMTSSVTTSQTINAPMVVTGGITIQNDSALSDAVFQIGGSYTREATQTVNHSLVLGGSNAGLNLFSGAISDGGASGTLALTKNGTGTWRVTGSNSYTGGTTVSAGVLEIGHNSALGTGSVSLGAGTLRAVGADREIANSLVVGNPASTIDGDFHLTIAGSVTQANGSRTLSVNGSGGLTLAGPVYIAESTLVGRTLTFAGDGVTAVTGVISNAASATAFNNAVTKQGAGTLILTGANNYTGATSIQEGVLQATDGLGLAATSNLSFGTGAGGVLQSSGTFSRTLGSSAGQVQWANNANGGFAANGGEFVIRLNGGTSAVTWGTSPFVRGTGGLVFGSTSADDRVDFQNGLGLANAARTIRVIDNIDSEADIARISGQITSSGVSGGLVKEGDGILELSHGNNTYQGATVVNAGTLLVSGTLANTSSVTVASGAILGGSGRINSTISGAGAINPGNSPGTLTATALNGDAGMDFNFEFTSGADDILRLTNGTTPFAGSGLLDSDNTISLYLDAATWTAIENGGSLVGGFYTDAGDFSSSLVGATIAGYYWNGSSYILITTGSFTVDMLADATFVPGGYVSEFTFTPVPEPGAWTLVTAAGLVLVVMRRRSGRV